MYIWQSNPYLVPVVIAAVISGAVVFAAWKRRPAPGASYLALLMLAVVEWSLGYALEFASGDLPAIVFWAKVEYLGIVAIPVLWVAFTLQYTGRGQLLKPRYLALLSVVPLITLLLVWTNELHGLIWRSVSLVVYGNSSFFLATHGAWFWVHTAYSYLLILFGTILLIHALFYSPHLYRGQAWALLIGALAPWLGNGLFLSGLSPFPHLDLTTFAFTVTGLALIWSLFRFRFLDIMPLARSAIIESMSDAVIVLDAQDRLIDLNPAAERLTGCQAAEAIGQPARQVLIDWPDLIDRHRTVQELHDELVNGVAADKRFFDLHLSSLCDRQGNLTGRLLVLRDITEYKKSEAAFRQVHDELETRVEERTKDLATANEKLLAEIAERAQAVEALRLSEAKYRLLVDEVNDGFYITDINGVLTFANRTLAHILGFEHSEALIGRNFLEFLQPSQADELAEVYRLAMATGTGSEVIAAEIVRQDGNRAFVEINPQVIFEGGKPVGNRGLLREVTESRREQALQQAVYRIANATETTRSLNDLFPQIHHIISSVMPAENFYITLYDEARNLLRFPYFKDAVDEPFIDEISPGKGLADYVLRTGESLLCTQAVHDELERQGAVILLGVPSKIWLGVPLIIEGKTIGAMVVQHYTDPNAYGEREQHMLEFVSSQVAIAITRKQGEQALKESQERYHGLFEHSPISLWEEDFTAVKLRLEALREQGIQDFRLYLKSHPQVIDECAKLVRIVDVNQATLELFGAERLEDLLVNLDQVLGDDSHESFKEELANIADGKVKFSWQGANRTLSGEPIDVSLTWSAAPGHEDDLSKVIISLQDITEQKRAEEALRNISLVDDLTGLYNRRGFFALAEQQLKLASRMNTSLLLLYSDLDQLKRINDTLGHPTGDLALIEVATVLKETFRDADILARLGGDEFVILAMETSEVSVDTLATRLQGTLKTHNRQAGRRYQLSLSIGIAIFDPVAPCSVTDLITQADSLMYQQKQAEK